MIRKLINKKLHSWAANNGYFKEGFILNEDKKAAKCGEKVEYIGYAKPIDKFYGEVYTPADLAY